ncbi:MAG TPA: DUF4097 family beta strand repeat-containing protein [Gemmatimonadales bacterium]
MPRVPMVLPLFALILPMPSQAQQPERYTLRGDDVAIYNLAGTVRLEPGDGDVSVQVTRGGAEAARLRMEQGELDGRETLRVIYPGDRIRYAAGGGHASTQLRVREDGTFGDLRRDEHDHDRRGSGEGRRVTIASDDGLDAHADLTIRVPRGRRVGVALAAGAVNIANVDGELLVDAASAPVTASGAKGSLDIDVGSGAVQVSDGEGELDVDTGSGSVDLSRFRGRSLSIDTGSGDVTGTGLECEDLSIETGSGDIRLTTVASPSLSLETGSGGVTAELRRDVASLSVETGSGDIAIRAPAALGATVEIETSSGDIETDFPLQVTRRGRSHLAGTIGDGKGTIEMETGSGEISLLKLPS